MHTRLNLKRVWPFETWPQMVLVRVILVLYIHLFITEAYQGKIFQAGALDVIYELLTNLPNHNVETVVAATAALKNISIHQGSEVSTFLSVQYVYMVCCVNVCVRTCIHVCIGMHVCMLVCVHACMCVCLYVCMLVCVAALIQR